MNRWTFQLYTFIGSWPWCFALAWVGYQLGVHWNDSPALHAVMHSLDLAVAIAILAVIVAFVVLRVRALRRG
jgi:membrane protein DedA with SNARE-associated domain